MKFKLGVALIIIQIFAVLGTAVGDGFGGMDAVVLIGYFLPGIIGLVLIFTSKK